MSNQCLEQVTFQCDDGHFVLDQHTWLDFYSATSLKQQLLHSDISSRLSGNQLLLLLLNVAYLAEKKHIQI